MPNYKDKDGNLIKPNRPHDRFANRIRVGKFTETISVDPATGQDVVGKDGNAIVVDTSTTTYSDGKPAMTPWSVWSKAEGVIESATEEEVVQQELELKQSLAKLALFNLDNDGFAPSTEGDKFRELIQQKIVLERGAFGFTFQGLREYGMWLDEIYWDEWLPFYERAKDMVITLDNGTPTGVTLDGEAFKASRPRPKEDT